MGEAIKTDTDTDTGPLRWYLMSIQPDRLHWHTEATHAAMAGMKQSQGDIDAITRDFWRMPQQERLSLARELAPTGPNTARVQSPFARGAS